MYDRNHSVLEVGDVVVLRGIVASIATDNPPHDRAYNSPSGPPSNPLAYGNIVFKADVNMIVEGQGNNSYNLTLNAAQVEKV